MAEHTPTPARGQDNATPATRQPGSLAGQRLGDYHLRELLGVGGMAEVYRAVDLVLTREVAVKVLSASLAVDAGYVDRFRAEARRVAALRHPHLVPVYHAGEDTLGGQRLLYLVMPLLRESLEDVLRREGKVPMTEAVRWVLQIADGLQAAHQHGLVHRDVKPANILLDAEGQALLADFGLAREVRRDPAQASRQPWGTPEYMAPEQLYGTTIDQRADIYALGIVLYEMLTGRRPYDGNSAYAIAAQALNEPLKPPSAYDAAIPAALEQVVLKALARDPGDRYPGMAEFALALRQAVSRQTGEPVSVTQATTVPLHEHSGLTPQPGGRANERLRLRWRWALASVLAAVLAAALLVAGPGVLAGLRQGQNAGSVSNAHILDPGGQASPTSDVSLLPGQTPATTPAATSAATATDSPHARPTATTIPQATATPAPTSALTIAPTPLILTPKPNDPKNCLATQTVRNNTASSVGWAWQKPTVSGFHFVIDNKPSVGWPSTITTTSPGGQDIIVVTAPCKPDPVSYAILVKDTLGGQYTFVMTLQ